VFEDDYRSVLRFGEQRFKRRAIANLEKSTHAKGILT
jgi:hypothetical protein